MTALAGDAELGQYREGKECSERDSEEQCILCQGFVIRQMCEGKHFPFVRVMGLT